LTAPAAADAVDPQQAVELGREALNSPWEGYPWYDPASDGVKRFDPYEPRPFPDFPLFGLPELIAWVMVTVVFAALAYLLVKAIMTLSFRAGRRRAGRRKGGSDDDLRRIEALPLPAFGDQGDFLDLARRCYQEGNYRQAIIFLFSYQLLELDKHNFIRLTRGKTNRQYLRELSPWQVLRRHLEQTTVVFEEVFFGDYPIDRARMDSCWSLLPEFQSLLGESEA
jgi:hypothetical protein